MFKTGTNLDLSFVFIYTAKENYIEDGFKD